MMMKTSYFSPRSVGGSPQPTYSPDGQLSKRGGGDPFSMSGRDATAVRYRVNIFLNHRNSLVMSLLLNFLCGLALAVVTGYAVFLITLSAYSSNADTQSSAIYLGWGVLFFIGLYLVYIALYGMYGNWKMNIGMLLRYFWMAFLGIAPLFMVSVASLDFNQVSKSWINHHWDGHALKTLRKMNCPDTWRTKCAAPVAGGPAYATITAWCLAKYQATDCESIRDKAVHEANEWIHFLLDTAGIIGVVNTASILVSMYLAVRLVTPPVIMKYANDNMNFVLLLPALGCGAVSFYLFIHVDYSPHHQWIASLFVVVASLTITNSVMGYVGGRLKLRKLLKIYMWTSAFLIVGLAALGTTGYVFSTILDDGKVYSNDSKRIACKAKLIGCCCCHDPAATDPCPEWEYEEIVTLVASDFRVAGLVALLSVFYETGGFLTGYLLNENLRSYHCEYI